MNRRPVWTIVLSLAWVVVAWVVWMVVPLLLGWTELVQAGPSVQYPGPTDMFVAPSPTPDSTRLPSPTPDSTRLPSPTPDSTRLPSPTPLYSPTVVVVTLTPLPTVVVGLTPGPLPPGGGFSDGGVLSDDPKVPGYFLFCFWDVAEDQCRQPHSELLDLGLPMPSATFWVASVFLVAWLGHFTGSLNYSMFSALLFLLVFGPYSAWFNLTNVLVCVILYVLKRLGIFK